MPEREGRLPQRDPASLYAAFDVYPSAKGAAAHIQHFSRTLFDAAGGGLLFCLGDGELPVHQREGDVEVLRFSMPIENVLQRSVRFGARLSQLMSERSDALRIAHFRDPFCGLPLVMGRPDGCRLVYEVNGLPSVEMPARYPHCGPATVAKLRALEDECLAAADVVVTPSATIAAALARRGRDGDVVVIPNGADAIPEASAPPSAPGRYVMYFGAVQPWQGVDVLLRAFARMRDVGDLHLVICASTRPRTTKGLRRLARRLGVEERVVWEHRLDKQALAGWLRGALLTVAPLTQCARNLEQGCCPLKVLESMSAGVPVVASDLPAVRELLAHDDTGYLVPPDRPADLSRAIRVLLDYPEMRARIGAAGATRVKADFTWAKSTARLHDVYASLLG